MTQLGAIDPYALTQEELDFLADIQARFGNTGGSYKAFLVIVQKLQHAVALRDAELASAKRIAALAESAATSALASLEAFKVAKGIK